ncbi:MAG: hypothetical protein IKV61_00125 [Clostridia bacterium]|nr:hypothetical protein [Clostridia bacterium]
MDKFGIFDILTKLSSNKTATDGVIDAVKNISNNLKTHKNEELKSGENKTIQKNDHAKKPKYSQSAILEVLKKHEELSKKIDENNKKP